MRKKLHSMLLMIWFVSLNCVLLFTVQTVDNKCNNCIIKRSAINLKSMVHRNDIILVLKTLEQTRIKLRAWYWSSLFIVSFYNKHLHVIKTWFWIMLSILHGLFSEPLTSRLIFRAFYADSAIFHPYNGGLTKGIKCILVGHLLFSAYD